MNQDKNIIRRRHVFYVPGYDPMPPRRYRELYRSEAAKQADISGYEIAVQGVSGQGERYHWNVDAKIDDASVHSRVEFLMWNDIVFDSMRYSVLQSYGLLFKTLWLYISSGALSGLFRLRRAPLIAAMYPVVLLLGQLLIAVLLAVLPVIFIPNLLGVVLGVLILTLVLMLFRKLDKKLFAFYLLHDFAFWAQSRGTMPQVLEPRVQSFAARIIEALDSDVDEVLIVGHSSGSHFAVNLVAEVLRQRQDASKLALLTVGQSIPVISFLPEAWDLRRDLQEISTRPDLCWLDVSAPGDGACFALSDPVAVSGVATSGQVSPKVISAVFSKTMSREMLKKTRWRFLRRHVQYLCAFDYPLDYDYFKITAGPVSLRDSFSGRGSSASVITKTYSPFISTGSNDDG